MESLNLSNSEITSSGISQFGILKNLQELDLSSNLINSEGANYLSSLYNLTSLALNDNSITGEGLRNFSNLTNLTELFLDNNNIGSVGANYLSSNTNIKFLTLSNNSIADEGLENFGNLKSLIHLNLNFNNVQRGLIYLSECKLLKQLDIQHNNLTDQELIDFFDKELSIEELDLSENKKLSGKSFKNICKQRKLSILNIGSNPKLGDLSLSHLASLNLLTLRANNCGITDKGLVKFLQENSNRNSSKRLNLYLEETPFTNIALEELLNQASFIEELQITFSSKFDEALTKKLNERIPKFFMSNEILEQAKKPNNCLLQ
ncbi:predicted protein [Naegleria gruberi]|uniref:Predicted protein n=1 Tax=Naegleria gruberi TaxID=5762 RepID=D2VU66_NAEGR|nr:uncharacterized protein NAEGRDRAFT_72553 [Naegleria gruberi]EFC39578.1 predicted protein [Naegleria gruberi]|eukprot:XP_002672322.1 predicted protein [Naegleria gruberi strain NEG-M]